MGSHPINLGLRFILELCAIWAAGWWGLKYFDGNLKYAMTALVPLALMVVWGVFAVPEDPSRSGAAPVPTVGWLRLVIELAIFAFATYGFNYSHSTKWAMIFAGIVILHYLTSYDSIIWLLRQ